MTEDPQPAPSSHGAYVIVLRHNGGAGLSGAIFDTKVRPGFTPPPWQKRIHDSIMDLARDVNSSDLEENRKVFYIRGLRDVMSDSCVRLSATPDEPYLSDDFMKYVSEVRREFDREIERMKYAYSQEVFGESQKHLVYFVPVLFCIAVVGSVLVLAFSGAGKEIGNYTLAAAAAIGGMIVFDWIPRPTRDFEDSARREREIKYPLGRMLFTVLITIAICLGVSSGAIEIKIGTWETVKLGEQTKLALFVGFLSGVPTSFLVRKFVAWVFDSKDDPKTTAGGRNPIAG
jgi:hypothetical protein